MNNERLADLLQPGLATHAHRLDQASEYLRTLGASIKGISMWQDIETMPRDETLVLLHEHGNVFIGHYWKEHNCCYGIYHGGPPLCYPSHWQPLPKPPQEE